MPEAEPPDAHNEPSQSAQQPADPYRALEASEQRYRDLVNAAADIIYTCDRLGYFTLFNPTAVTLLGYAPEEILGRHFLDLIHPDYRKAARRFYWRQVRDRIPNTYYEYPAIASDGREVWLGQNVQLLFEQGEVSGTQAVARDITARRAMEAELIQTRAELERRVEKRTAELQAINRALEAEIAQRQRLTERHQRLMEISAAITASLDLNTILRLVRDAIVEAGDFDRAGVWLVDGNIVSGAWGTDEAGNLTDEHATVETLADWGPNLPTLVAGKAKYYIEQFFEGDLSPAAEASGPVWHGVIPLMFGDELLGLISVDNLLSRRPVTPENVGALLGFTEQAAVAIRNARLLAERTRHLERQRRLAALAAATSARRDLRDILKMARDAIVEVCGFDRAAIFLYDRDRNVMRAAWGTSRTGEPQDAPGGDVEAPSGPDPAARHLVRGDLACVLYEDFSRRFALPPTDEMYGVHANAIVHMRADGQLVGMLCVDNLLRDAPITDEAIEALLPFAEQIAVAVRDTRLFADLQHTQDALVHSEKLRAIGELASGVAHNVNNVLMAVMGYAELIELCSEEPEQVRAHAHTIATAAADGAEVVRRLQQFARKEAADRKDVFDLGAITLEALHLTRPAWRNQPEGRGAVIQPALQIQDELWVEGIPSEIREVLVNLIRNAVDAMPNGGSLTLRAYAERGYAVAEVEDTGAGMDEATRQRVFEPFFTTKGIGLGTGLGLSVAWGIVDRHGGRISVQSSPGRGSLFRLQIPLSRRDRAEAVVPARPDALAGRRILIVEDDDLVRGGLVGMLIAQGAHVEAAAAGEEALTLLQRDGAHFDAVVSDQGMAGITGIDLLAQTRERRPAVRRVLLSGWGADLSQWPDADVADLILTKPISSDDLARALSSLW